MRTAAITDAAHPDLPLFQRIYEDAFPEDERCPWERMVGFLRQPGHFFRLEGIYLESGAPIGFNAFAEFGRILYGIYLAVDRPHRGAGYGQRVLRASVSVQVPPSSTWPSRASVRETSLPSASNSKMRMPTSAPAPVPPPTFTE